MGDFHALLFDNRFGYSPTKEGRKMSIWDRVTNLDLLRKEIKRLEAELAREKAKPKAEG